MKYIFYERSLLTKVGGVETAAWNLAREFYALGSEVLIVTGKGPRKCPYKELEPFVCAFDYVPQANQPRIFGRRFAKILENRSLAKAADKILVNSSKQTAIIFFKPNGVYALRKRLPHFKKVCFHSQGADFVPFDRMLFNKYVTHLSACSHFNAWQNRCHFKQVPKVFYNGVPDYFLQSTFSQAARDEWRKQLSTDSKTRVFAFAGRMVKWKGIAIFLEAMTMAGGDEELWLVGTGPDLKRWLALAKVFKIENRVKTHPFIEHSKLPGLWDAVDIGVFPSCSDEGFSMSVVEAMSRGKPVIASYLGGTPEGVGNEGLCGWLCSNSDVEGFAKAISHAREADLVQMGQNARKRAERFRWPVEAKHLLNFIAGPGNMIAGNDWNNFA